MTRQGRGRGRGGKGTGGQSVVEEGGSAGIKEGGVAGRREEEESGLEVLEGRAEEEVKSATARATRSVSGLGMYGN